MAAQRRQAAAQERARLEAQRVQDEQVRAQERARLERERAEKERAELEARKPGTFELLDKYTSGYSRNSRFNVTPPPASQAANNNVTNGMKTDTFMIYVLSESDGWISWRLFMNVHSDDFARGNKELPAKMKAAIKEAVAKAEGGKENIGRVRVMRYGPRHSDKKAEQLAQDRAKAIFDEINANRQNKQTDTFEQLLQEAKRRREAAQTVYKLTAASFYASSDALSEDAKANIALLAQDIKRRTYDVITIEGHADSTGSEALNTAISAKRAESVYSELAKQGVPTNKMKTVGLGSKVPASNNSSEQGRASNRRVEIFLE